MILWNYVHIMFYNNLLPKGLAIDDPFLIQLLYWELQNDSSNSTISSVFIQLEFFC